MVLKDILNARSFEDLSRHQRHLVLYVVGLVGIILFYTVVYNTGMRTLEGDPHSIFRSFQTVVETMTTTGYGADSPWSTPWMNMLVVLMQLSGIAIGFFTLRLLIIPLFERTSIDLENRLTSKDDHVVICEYRQDSDILLDELERLGIDYVLIDSDKDEAQRLSNDGYQAISGDPEEAETLKRATIEDAALVITDAGDRNASIVLTALDLNEDLRVVSLTESSRRNRALTEIGVDSVVSPTPSSGADSPTKPRRRSRFPRAPPSARTSRSGSFSSVTEVRFATPRCARRRSSTGRTSRWWPAGSTATSGFRRRRPTALRRTRCWSSPGPRT